jgi:uncharacterized coiled-coil protein SlyX
MSEIEKSATSELEQAIGIPAEEAEAQEATEDQMLAEIVSYIDTIQSSLAAMQVGLRVINNRLSSLENYVAYLLKKDPEAGPKVEKLLESLKQQSTEKST